MKRVAILVVALATACGSAAPGVRVASREGGPADAAAPGTEPTVRPETPAVGPSTAPRPPADSPATADAAGTGPPIADGWEIVFEEDFDDGLSDVWNTCHWWQVDGGCTIASNGELQWYRPEGVQVADGELRLRATTDLQRTTDGGALPYRSGMVTTGPTDNDDEDSSFAFTYGRVSVRAMVPSGEGTWPAVWLLSADKTSLPEIDIFEWYGNRPGTVTSHVHNRVEGERAKERVETTVEDFADQWHTFTATWDPDEVVFTIDGIETGRVTDPELVPQSPMYLVANLAIGGEAGPVDERDLPATFRIDEIVVSQKVGS